MVTFIQPFTDVLVIEQREPATKRRSLRESSHLRQRLGQSSYPVIKLEPQHLNYQCQGEKIWLTHFKKVTRTICLKSIFDHNIDILKPGPLISTKTDQRQKCNPSPTKMALRLYLLRWRRTISLGNCLSYGATVHKSSKLIEFQF